MKFYRERPECRRRINNGFAAKSFRAHFPQLFLTATLFFAVTLVWPSHANGEDLMSMVFQASMDRFKGMQSVYCDAEIQGKDGENYNKLATVKYGVQQTKIFFDYIQNDDSGNINWSECYTWDGKKSEDFHRSDNNLLYIYPYRFPCPTMDGRNLLLDPYAFLLRERNERSGSCLLLSELEDPAQWRAFAATVSSIKREKSALGNCIVIDCSGGTLPRLNKMPYAMKIWFDGDHGYFPVQWQRISMSGAILDQYNVLEFGYLDSSKLIPYPKITEFARNARDGQPFSKIRCIITGVQNNAIITSDRFSINPMLANSIFDAATNVFIPVDRPEKPK